MCNRNNERQSTTCQIQQRPHDQIASFHRQKILPMDSEDYYKNHRELTSLSPRQPRKHLNSNLANHHPIVQPLVQSTWLAQLKRLDDPHTLDLALKYIRKYIISKLEQPQIPSFLACFSQSTDHKSRRQCSRIGCLLVFQGLCELLSATIVTKHAQRISSAMCLYVSDPDQAVRNACCTAVEQLVNNTSASLDAIVAPFLSLLRSSHRWQAQDGACQCLVKCIDTLKNNTTTTTGNDPVELQILQATARKLLNVTRSLVKKIHPSAKSSLYLVLLSCAQTLASVNVVGPQSSSTFKCGPLIRTICDDIAISNSSSTRTTDLSNTVGSGSQGSVWQSRRSAALTLGEIVLLGKYTHIDEDEIETVRCTLEEMMFDKVPGVRASVQAVLQLDVLGGTLESIPKHGSSGVYKYGRRRKKYKSNDLGTRQRPLSPERGVAVETVDAAIQQAFTKTPHGLPKAVTHVQGKMLAATHAMDKPSLPPYVGSGKRSGNNTKHKKRSPPQRQRRLAQENPEDEEEVNVHRTAASNEEDQKSTASSKSARSAKSLKSARSVKSVRSVRSMQSKKSNGDDQSNDDHHHDHHHDHHDDHHHPATPGTPHLKAQLHQIKKQQVLFANDLKLMREEMGLMMNTMTGQMNKLEHLILSTINSKHVMHNGNFQPSTVGPPSSNLHYSGNSIGSSQGRTMPATQDLSRPRKHIEAAGQYHSQQQYHHGGAELSLSTCVSNGSDDGEVIRQCNGCGASTLNQLSVQTKKKLFSRFISMMERNAFVLQIIPWFQTAFNLRLLHQTLASPGIYARAITIFQKYSKAGNQTSLSIDCRRLYQYLASTDER